MTQSEPQRRIYLDCNATAPLRPEARAAMLDRLDRTGNASSIHAEGRAARSSIESARSVVGQLAGVTAERITFTSGATEAAALALTPDLTDVDDGRSAARLLIGATEHPAVARGHRFAAAAVDTVPVDADGVIDRAALERLLHQPGRSIVAVQAANGETGVIQPIADVARLVHGAGGLLVCDAVQAAGRIDCTTLGADVLIFSGHKIGGPQGVGALVAVCDGLRFGTPLLRGGGQERGLRGGTENGVAIAGFGAAARVAAERSEVGRIAALRHVFEASLRAVAPDVVIFGEGAERLPNTTAFAIPGLAGETLLIGLDLAGVAVSTGSACSSGKVSRSTVLDAMGIDPHLNAGMLRVSLGWASTDADVATALGVLDQLVRRMRRGPARAAA